MTPTPDDRPTSLPDPSWVLARDYARRSFDAISDLYGQAFANKLEGKPLDLEFKDETVSRISGAAIVVEVGAGPGQVCNYLDREGITPIATDVSRGQLDVARSLSPHRLLVACDLARLPLRRGAVAGIVSYYSLMYGPASGIDVVMADWLEVLAPGGAVFLGFHAGSGTYHESSFGGRAIDITLVRREPKDMVSRLRLTGFAVDSCVVRPPYREEHLGDRCYITAHKPLDGVNG